MIRHQQFNLHFLASADFGRTRADAHAGLDLGFTGRYDLTAALGKLYFHQTDSAGAGAVIERGEFAQRRNENTRTARSFQNRVVGFERDRLAVDKGAAAEVRHFVFVGISHCRSLLGILFNR